jgi:hypothetical protein
MPLSSITNKHEKSLEVKDAKMKLDESKFADVKPSESFQRFSKRIAERWNLKAEIGRRILIDLYLLDACGDLTEEDNLAIFPEHTVEKTEIAKNLVVHGNIDYVIATAEHSQGVRQGNLFQGEEFPNKPFFCVVEAKKEESFGSGRCQTLAEMKTIWKIAGGNQSVNGALTDGVRWIFYRLSADGGTYYVSDIIDHPTKSHIITGTLQSFIRGDLPAGFELPT